MDSDGSKISYPERIREVHGPLSMIQGNYNKYQSAALKRGKILLALCIDTQHGLA